MSFLFLLFLVLGSSSGVLPSLFSASGLVSVYLIFGRHALPLGSIAVSGLFLLGVLVSLGVPMKKCWVVAGLGNVSGDGGLGWVLDDAVALSSVHRHLTLAPAMFLV